WSSHIQLIAEYKTELIKVTTTTKNSAPKILSWRPRLLSVFSRSSLSAIFNNVFVS
ncbi:hypothetical protein D030_2404B, partial [Vibrio parahaemolyticus AQ3810]